MKNVLKAIADFQQECPVIHKGTKGYGYSYAELSTILEVINPLLKKHGLGFTQPPQSGNIVHTIVFHAESGEMLTSDMEIPQGVKLGGMNDFQVLGSAVTYLRRYALSSMLGIVTDKDVDGAGAPVAGTTKPPSPAKSSITDEKLTAGLAKWDKVEQFETLKKKFTLTTEQESKVADRFNELFPNHKK